MFRSAAVHSVPSLLLRNQLMGQNPCHIESCHCYADRLWFKLGEAKQKHKAIHTWLLESPKIEGLVSMWGGDILAATPRGTWGQHKHWNLRTLSACWVYWQQKLYLTVANVCGGYVRHFCEDQTVQTCVSAHGHVKTSTCSYVLLKKSAFYTKKIKNNRARWIKRKKVCVVCVSAKCFIKKSTMHDDWCPGLIRHVPLQKLSWSLKYQVS